MRRRWIAGATAVVAGAAGSPALLPAAAASAAPTTSAAAVTYYRPSDGVLHIAGHGFGHGHGLSQWGAYGGATVGQTYKQILSWYFAAPAFGTASGNISSAYGGGSTASGITSSAFGANSTANQLNSSCGDRPAWPDSSIASRLRRSRSSAMCAPIR